MNVLLTCAGRRNYLVHFFQHALEKRGQVIACDSSASAPALAEADQKIIVPSMDHPEYFDGLLKICRERRVRLLVSVNDPELAGLARNAERLRAVGTIPLVASPETIATCQDKWAAFQWMRRWEIPTPQTYLTLTDALTACARGEVRYPLILKPRWGTTSIGVEIAPNERELFLAYEWGKIQLQRSFLAKLSQGDPEHSFIFQECLDGQEYGIDVVNDLSGCHVATLARQKLAMRAGNTDRAVTVSDAALERIGQQIGEHLAHLGPVDCDLMKTAKGYFVLDINPRFGGGYPFSHLAGANLPAALVAWANGKAAEPAWLRSQAGVLSAKFDGMSVVERPACGLKKPSSGVMQSERQSRNQHDENLPIAAAHGQ